jgi:DNA-binding NarL/FixJ family response regulator
MARRAHLLYFLAQAELAEPLLYEAEGPTWLRRLSSEHDNLRAALSWALNAEQTELALRLAASLYRFWRLRGYVHEARRWLAHALHAPSEIGRESKAFQFGRARALNASGVLARDAGDFVEARSQQAASVALFETLGDTERLANAEQNYGQVLFRLGEREAARTHLEASLARLRRFDAEAQARSASLFPCLGTLGQLAMQAGDHVAARTHLVEAEAHARTVGSPHQIAQALTYVGVLDLQMGEHAAAVFALREALRIAADVGDAWSIFQALHVLASAAAAQGQNHRAAVLTAAFEAVGGRAGIRTAAEIPALEALLRNTLAGLDPVDRAVADAAGAAMAPEEAIAYALADGRPTTACDHPTDAAAPLSPREREVARLIVLGYGNRQIAEELVIAEPTAERHVANIFSKLGVHSRAQIAAWAAEHLRSGM